MDPVYLKLDFKRQKSTEPASDVQSPSLPRTAKDAARLAYTLPRAAQPLHVWPKPYPGRAFLKEGIKLSGVNALKY